MEALLEIDNIEVVYNKSVQVLRGLSLRVPKGAIVALLGSNGAGKSTTLKSVSGLLTLEDGDVVVAKGDYHLEVVSNVAGNLRVRLTEGERVHGVRPAIDVTMRTAAERVSDPLVGVALTGMGKDGAAGIEAVKRAGGATIAQDEASSPVFGIPRKAIETGCAGAVASAADVPGAICDAFAQEASTYG